MTPTPTKSELRPAEELRPTPDVPLLRLRARGREPVPPEACLLGPRCLVCAWRRAGLLDLDTEAVVPEAGDSEAA